MSTDRMMSRRHLLKAAGGAAAFTALGAAWRPGAAHAAGDGFGLHILEHQAFDRMHYYRFQTTNVSWNPAVNVLLPNDYFTTTRRYPVMYLLHGGAQDFRKFDMEDDIRGLTNGRPLIVVMPDGGTAGWYSNPVRSFSGARNYESFHINQLIPWIDANFR
ncbi:MAG: alpha/beta hydrolase-fold protein, partial [Acidimicrobiales bacterium]|nr:alpha/beta hydrolase-fold protein [Acidimicrobiales bacterium]